MKAERKIRINLGTYDKAIANIIREEQKKLGNSVVLRGRGPRVHNGRYYQASLPLYLAEKVAVYLIYKEKATWKDIYG